MSQARIRATTTGSGLVFSEPKPSLQRHHGVRLTNGVAGFLPNQTFDVVVANFSIQARRLPKRTVVGYAKRDPLAILKPERRVGAEMAPRCISPTWAMESGGEELADQALLKYGRRKPRTRTDNQPVECPSLTEGTTQARDKAPKFRREIGKKKWTCHTSKMTSSAHEQPIQT